MLSKFTSSTLTANKIKSSYTGVKFVGYQVTSNSFLNLVRTALRSKNVSATFFD